MLYRVERELERENEQKHYFIIGKHTKGEGECEREGQREKSFKLVIFVFVFVPVLHGKCK